jgi:hypothetical protein
MKAAGFFLLLAGWGLVLAALGMLHAGVARTAFLAAGVAVELSGLTLAALAHRRPSRERGRGR